MSRRAPAPPPKSSSSTVRTVVLVGVVAAIAALILSRGFGGSSTPKTGAGGVATTKAPKTGSVTTVDAALTTVATTAAPPTVAPAALKVVVLNGNGIGGTAGKRAAELVKLGYAATVAKDAVKKDFAETAIYYTSPDMKDVANVLAGKMGLTAGPAPADPATYVDPANIAGINVIVLLGKDKASTPIAANPAAAAVAPTTAPPLTAAKPAATPTTKKP